MINEKLIALYFEDKLTAQQKIEFDNLMKFDVEFQSQVTLEKQLKTAIISVKKDALHEQLKQLEKVEKPNSFYKIVIAACIVLVLGLFGWFQQNKSYTNTQLFAQHYKAYPNSIAPKSRGNSLKDLKTEAFAYYDSKNYKLASEKFEQLYKTNDASYYLFYNGICQLELGKTKNAIQLFEEHKKYATKLSTHRNWYLALAYLNTGDVTKSKIILQEIVNEKSYKHKDAKTILKEIE